MSTGPIAVQTNAELRATMERNAAHGAVYLPVGVETLKRILDEADANAKEIRNLKGYGDDPTKGPIYVSIFQHQEAIKAIEGKYQRWASTGNFHEHDVRVTR